MYVFEYTLAYITLPYRRRTLAETLRPLTQGTTHKSRRDDAAKKKYKPAHTLFRLTSVLRTPVSARLCGQQQRPRMEARERSRVELGAVTVAVVWLERFGLGKAWHRRGECHAGDCEGASRREEYAWGSGNSGLRRGRRGEEVRR